MLNFRGTRCGASSLRRCMRPRAGPQRRFGTSSAPAVQQNSRNQWSWMGAFALGASSAGLCGYLGFDRTRSQGGKPKMVLDKSKLPSGGYAKLQDMRKAIEEISHELHDVEDVISTDDDDLLAHGYSEWSSINCENLPVAVAYPRTTEHVSVIARVCSKWKVPIIPFSGGSSIEGHIGAPFGGISVDFAFMDQVLRVSADDMDVTVQPGITWTDLNEHLAKLNTGLFFPMDPAPSAKIGGMVATNCSGTNAVRYGTMRDWVINLTVVLADGVVVKTRRRPRKCSAGYNLNGIFVGSEGTLGLVTEATLKLAPIPSVFSVAVVPFPDLRSAISAAASVIRKGVPITAVELMDDVQMRIVNRSGATGRSWEEKPTLFFKFSGTTGTVQDNIQSVQRVISEFNPGQFEWAKDKKQQELLWSARKESLYSLLALRKDGEVLWNTDVAVPLSRLADIIEASKNEARELGLNATVKGHIGDSNFHENITYNAQDPIEFEKAEKAVKNMVKRAIDMEGTCTGEHGIGLGKKKALEQELGADTLTLMKVIKAAVDPNWIMNPGKVFDRN